MKTNWPAVATAISHRVATDGVTPVLMRLKTGLAGEGCFEIMSNTPPAQGRISAGVVNTKTVAGLEQAFSFYFPPDEFVDSAGTRTVDVEFTYTPVVAGKRANTTRFRFLPGIRGCGGGCPAHPGREDVLAVAGGTGADFQFGEWRQPQRAGAGGGDRRGGLFCGVHTGRFNEPIDKFLFCGGGSAGV